MAGLSFFQGGYQRGLIPLFIAGGIFGLLFWNTSFAAKPEKDKTPPVITELRAESVTENSAVIMWTTDEPADSDIKYGIAPRKNINGPRDTALVLSHAISLSSLLAETEYAYCVTSRDEANNKAEACGTFTTSGTPPPPPPPTGGGGAGGARPTLAYVSGFAYPHAVVSVALHPLPLGADLQAETEAADDGSFSASFYSFPQGLYLFTVSAKDTAGESSARKGFQFDFRAGDGALYEDKLIIPPTLRFSRDVVSHGDDVLISGSATPNAGVLVEAGGVFYETKSDEAGEYTVLINTARLPLGKVSVRARSSLVSESGYDFSLSKTLTLSSTSVPEADLNADGTVDIADFSIFVASPVDMNKDGAVNAADVSIFLRAFAGMNN